MFIELIQWTKHKKSIVVGLVTHDRKTTTCYLRLVIDVCLRHWYLITYEDTFVDYAKLQLAQEKDKNKILGEQSRKAFIEVITKE
jgi:hypothetical protein